MAIYIIHACALYERKQRTAGNYYQSSMSVRSAQIHSRVSSDSSLTCVTASPWVSSDVIVESASSCDSVSIDSASSVTTGPSMFSEKARSTYVILFQIYVTASEVGGVGRGIVL